MQVEPEESQTQRLLLIEPTVIPMPPSGPLTEKAVMTHIKELYDALSACNASKEDYINVYYPSDPSETVPSGD